MDPHIYIIIVTCSKEPRFATESPRHSKPLRIPISNIDPFSQQFKAERIAFNLDEALSQFSIEMKALRWHDDEYSVAIIFPAANPPAFEKIVADRIMAED